MQTPQGLAVDGIFKNGKESAVSFAEGMFPSLLCSLNSTHEMALLSTRWCEAEKKGGWGEENKLHMTVLFAQDI